MSSSGATTAFTLSLSTLPTDPLATVVLYLTEGELAQLLRTQKAMLTRELESDEFWRERCCSTFGQHLQHIQALDKNAFRAFLAAKQCSQCMGRAGQNTQETRVQCIKVEQLLNTCVGASSQDNDDEMPRHTLVPSPCAMMLRAAAGIDEGRARQIQCGCMHFLKCYWSSEPSPIADRDEWLEYDLVDSLAVLSSFVLTPYTSFWQPQAPTYNPVEACFQLFHPQINGGKKPYYESPRFRVGGSMERQEFDLPQPILSLGGRAKVLLLGMAQRQTLSGDVGETANHYHICLSYVAFSGTRVLSCRLADNCEAGTRSPVEGSGVHGNGGGGAAKSSSAEREKKGERAQQEEGERRFEKAQEKKQGIRLQWVE